MSIIYPHITNHPHLPSDCQCLRFSISVDMVRMYYYYYTIIKKCILRTGSYVAKYQL